MSNQGWVQLLNDGAPWQTTQGTVLNTAVTATISTQAAGGKDYAVATSYFKPGSVFRLTAQGLITTTATSSVFTIFPAAGATPTALCTPVGITTGTTVITGLQWMLMAICRVTALGSTGNTISSQGWLELGNTGAAVPANPIALTAAATGMKLPMPNASGETAAAIDNTSAVAMMIRGTSTVAGPSMQCTQFLIESMC